MMNFWEMYRRKEGTKEEGKESRESTHKVKARIARKK